MISRASDAPQSQSPIDLSELDLAEMQQADGLALGTISHPHQFLGALNLYQWVAFAAAHEFRHAAQIREQANERHTNLIKRLSQNTVARVPH